MVTWDMLWAQKTHPLIFIAFFLAIAICIHNGPAIHPVSSEAVKHLLLAVDGEVETFLWSLYYTGPCCVHCRFWPGFLFFFLTHKPTVILHNYDGGCSHHSICACLRVSAWCLQVLHWFLNVLSCQSWSYLWAGSHILPPQISSDFSIQSCLLCVSLSDCIIVCYSLLEFFLFIA